MTCLHMDHRGRQRSNEMHVVTDENDRSLIGLQSPDQRVDTWHVQVGCGFVEEKKSGVDSEGSGDGDPLALSAAELRGLFFGIVE